MRVSIFVPVMLVFLSLLSCVAAAVSHPQFTVSFHELTAVEAGGVYNIKLSYHQQLNGKLSIHYGSCKDLESGSTHHVVGSTYVGDHELAKRHREIVSDQRPTTFVWLPPADTPAGGCLKAFSNDTLVGRSAPFSVSRRKSRRHAIPIAEIADSLGPWFDGVEYLQAKEPGSAFVAKAKSKSVGILGGGMAGLMTSMLLDSVGMHNWHILEASNRVGGRVHTAYLNGTRPDQYQYQELGPMRFPVSIFYPEENETVQIQDHRLVFQVADYMNKMNQDDPAYKVSFIPWLQTSRNQPVSTPHRRPDGTIPGAAEVEADPSLASNVTASYSDATAVQKAQAEYEDWVGLDDEKVRQFAANIFKAHKAAVEAGVFDFSEAGFIRYALHETWDITDQAADGLAGVDPSWEYDSVYFAADTWRTIDQGLSRLPHAFEPHVLNKTTLGANVAGMSWDSETEKMTVSWRPTESPLAPLTDATFDYTVVAVPFSKVRIWNLPSFSSLLSRAIRTFNYQQACKVALHYSTRFWEHLENPIIGGCGSVNIPGIGSVCFPSYKINSTGPGVILASYQSGTYARTLGSMTDEQHVAYVVRAMREALGPQAETEWTGNYDRMCWENNEFQAGAWAAPSLAQQPLYLPSFFTTQMNTIFIGEATSYTHAWIFSALESAVRGTTQLLLDMGLVNEAKEVVETWMARWISV